MYDPFASLIADYLAGSDIDRPLASGIHAVCVLPSSVYPLPSSFPSFLAHCRDTHREYTAGYLRPSVRQFCAYVRDKIEIEARYQRYKSRWDEATARLIYGGGA